MKVDVASLLEEPYGSTGYASTWDASVLELENPACEVRRPIEVAFTLRHVEGIIEAEGRYEGRLDFRCSRCLDDYDRPLDGQLEAHFYPEERELPSGEEELEEEDPGRIYLVHYRESRVDLGDVVRQDINLHCPMQPLCRPDCQGLCTVCGQNLNQEDCGHEQQRSMDPRLAGLKDLDLPSDDG